MTTGVVGAGLPAAIVVTAPTMEQLRDWDPTSVPTNGQVPTYDSTTGLWKAQTGGGGGGVTSLAAGNGISVSASTGAVTVSMATSYKIASGGNYNFYESDGTTSVLFINDSGNVSTLNNTLDNGSGALTTAGHIAATGTGSYISSADYISANSYISAGSYVSAVGSVQITGSTSGTLTMAVPSTVTAYTLTWPSAVTGTAGYVLSSDTSGNLSWVANGSGGSSSWSSLTSPTANLTLSMSTFTTLMELPSNTAAAWEFSDGTNAYYTINSQTATSGISAHTWSAAAPTLASASGTTWSLGTLTPGTITLTGTTTVTAMHGLGLYINAPTITDASAATVSLASTLYLTPPLHAGSATVTNGVGLYIANPGSSAVADYPYCAWFTMAQGALYGIGLEIDNHTENGLGLIVINDLNGTGIQVQTQSPGYGIQIQHYGSQPGSVGLVVDMTATSSTANGAWFIAESGVTNSLILVQNQTTTATIAQLMQQRTAGTAIAVVPNSTSTGLTYTAFQTGYGTTSVSTAYFTLLINGNMSWPVGGPVNSAKITSGSAWEWTDSGNSDAIMMALSTAAVTIASGYTLSVAVVSNTSDVRRKDDWTPYGADYLNELRSALVGRYSMMDGQYIGGGWRAGVSAQSLPTTVHEVAEDGYYSIRSIDMMAWQTGVSKALLGEIDALRERVDRLERENAELRAGTAK